jgi:hypothetical protein
MAQNWKKIYDRIYRYFFSYMQTNHNTKKISINYMIELNY